MKIHTEDYVSQMVIENPSVVPVLERYQVRFYDSRSESLEAACAHAGAPLEKVLGSLEEAAAAPKGSERWDFAPLPALVRFILDNHHTWERNKVFTLQGQMEEAVRDSGDRYPELRRLQLIFAGVSKWFLAHMKSEEVELFPTFLHEVAPGAAESQRAQKAFELIPLTDRLVEDHDVLLAQWEAMRALTSQFRAPEGAKPVHQALMRALVEFEGYQHQHVHKENFILFAKIRQMALKR
jgi:regulator of cell morphogenesis and NO signaling